jgi:hypothetical protein
VNNLDVDPNSSNTQLTMRTSTLLVSALAMVANAAPQYPEFDIYNMKEPAAAVENLSNWFNKVAYKAKAAGVVNQPPICDVSSAQMPSCKCHPLIPRQLPPHCSMATSADAFCSS